MSFLRDGSIPKQLRQCEGRRRTLSLPALIDRANASFASSSTCKSMQSMCETDQGGTGDAQRFMGGHRYCKRIFT